MDERHLTILKQSRTEINRLQLLSVFFEEETVYKIYLRTQVIHQLFEQNEELDIDKLELFHVQFTQSVVELLRKIKKNNEKNVSLLYAEIDLNETLIGQMEASVFTQQEYKLAKQKQSLKINQSLRRLFDVLSDLSTEFPFAKNILSFSARFAKDFYYSVSPDQLAALIDFDPKLVYTNTHAVIEKKLMGLLCKHEFRTEFFYGLKSGQQVIELYKFLDVERYYLFFPGRNLFLFCDLNDLKELDFSNNLSDKQLIIQELEFKNDTLRSSAAVLKTAIPSEIVQLLEENYHKISDISFLDHLNNFDVQANILKAMLRTDLF